MRSDLPYPEFLGFQLTPVIGAALQELCEALRPLTPWREYARIPHRGAPTSPIRMARDWVSDGLHRRNSFVRVSPLQAPRLHRLERRFGSPTSRLFRFLCLGEPIDIPSLASWAGEATVRRCIECGAGFVRDEKLLLAVSLIPFEGHCYMAAARHLADNRALYGVQPPDWGELGPLQIELLRRYARKSPCRSFLEIGTGIGWVTLELGDLIPERLGLEISADVLTFAEANRRLRGDGAAKFGLSDLFAGAPGIFDLIAFNPWQPSERALDVILRFLRELPDHLTPGGRALLITDSATVDRRDALMAAIAEETARSGLYAERWIAGSYHGEGALRTYGGTWISRDGAGRRGLRTLPSIGRFTAALRGG